MQRTQLVVLLLSFVLCLPSCAKQPRSSSSPKATATATTSEIVAVNRDITFAEFVADVAAYTEGGECDTRTIPGLGRQVGLAFPDRVNTVRRVWLTYADNGEIIGYSDVRGDLVRKVVGPDGGPPRAGEPVKMAAPAGRQTFIDINLQTHFGLAQNVGGGQPPVSVAARSEIMMKAPSLDHPEAMVQVVVSRCVR